MWLIIAVLGATSLLVTSASQAQSLDTKTISEVAATTRSTCLSGSQYDLQVNADRSLSLLKLEPGEQGTIRITQSTGAGGALNYQDEGKRLKADKNIIDCISQNLPVLLTAAGARLAPPARQAQPVLYDLLTKIVYGATDMDYIVGRLGVPLWTKRYISYFEAGGYGWTVLHSGIKGKLHGFGPNKVLGVIVQPGDSNNQPVPIDLMPIDGPYYYNGEHVSIIGTTDKPLGMATYADFGVSHTLDEDYNLTQIRCRPFGSTFSDEPSSFGLDCTIVSDVSNNKGGDFEIYTHSSDKKESFFADMIYMSHRIRDLLDLTEFCRRQPKYIRCPELSDPLNYLPPNAKEQITSDYDIIKQMLGMRVDGFGTFVDDARGGCFTNYCDHVFLQYKWVKKDPVTASITYGTCRNPNYCAPAGSTDIKQCKMETSGGKIYVSPNAEYKQAVEPASQGHTVTLPYPDVAIICGQTSCSSDHNESVQAIVYLCEETP
jgi:hypothetical protein